MSFSEVDKDVEEMRDLIDSVDDFDDLFSQRRLSLSRFAMSSARRAMSVLYSAKGSG